MSAAVTKQLRIVGGSTITLDEEDFWRFWKHKLFSYSSGIVYFRDEEENRTFRLHREIMNIRDERIVTFLDGDPRNLTRSNLLVQDRGVYGRARPSQSASGYKGVSPYRGKWQATIRVSGKLQWLGTFPTAEEAARAYDDAVLEHRGRKGVLNFPTRARRRAKSDSSN
ncbi:hypothetical protein BH23GEM3_BH23GEM3_06840 [soil metagenome]|jgi:hypothetical protein|nr:AP2/ERF family transcription factor [Gemmatimonadota bacterium]